MRTLKILFVAAGLLAGFFVPAHAGLFTSEADAVYVQHISPTVTNSTATLVIDLSDTVNYPHKETGSLKIVGLDVLIDQVAAGTSTVKLGVVTGVNTTSGTVTWFQNFDASTNVSNTNKNFRRYFVPAELDLRVNSSGGTPALLSKDKTTITPVVNSPLLYQSDVPLPDSRGSDTATAPAKGDMVMEIQASPTNGAKVTLGVLYYAIP